MGNHLTLEERETTSNYNEADNFWEVYTAVRKHMNKFEKLGWEYTNIEYYPDGEISGKFYKVSNCAISFRSPVKIKRSMTEEQREAARERLQKLRSETRLK